MSSTFSRSTRSLERDSALPAAVWLGLGLAVGLGWLGWFLLARVPVYEVATGGRLEVQRAAYPLATTVGGRVVSTRLEVGREVRAGEVLVELDAESERLELEATRLRIADLDARLAAGRRELALEREAAAGHAAARAAAVGEAEARVEEAEVRARLADEEADRVERLHRAGGISDLERDRLLAEAGARREAANALRLSAVRLEREGAVEASDRLGGAAELERMILELEGARAQEESRIAQLEHLVEQRRVYAPAAGRVAGVAAFAIGSVLRPGDELGTILPAGEVRAAARFRPEAMGRIRTGQPARVRLSGFAWTQYGWLRAEVAEVEREPRDGAVRVGLRLVGSAPGSIPLEHGLPGVAEVEVERASPLELVLRVAGKAVAP